jgi:hypothetical protein
LKNRNAGARKCRELLIKEEEVVGFNFGMRAAAAEPRQCGDTGGTWRRDIEDAKSFALESRPRLVYAGSFNGASYNLASRGSQSTNKLSHGSRFYLTRRGSRSSIKPQIFADERGLIHIRVYPRESAAQFA